MFPPNKRPTRLSCPMAGASFVGPSHFSDGRLDESFRQHPIGDPFASSSSRTREESALESIPVNEVYS
jgi:hypothetical protein